MGVAEELEKLADLHRSGALSEREYADAKEAVLRGATSGTTRIGEAANRYVTFQIVMAAVGLIVFFLFLFLVFLPRWNSFP
ncbi:MAG TPA: SHOCT domain-containing protein [Candidatus Limnocylindria bacterium]|nr:SHOCT domain-containing protein [Candidatus Limnocylindria bacterium]